MCCVFFLYSFCFYHLRPMLVQGKAPGGLMGWIDPKRLQIPKTGDSSVLGLWGISLCTSLAGCLALTTWQIRRRREEESLQIIKKQTGSPLGARANSPAPHSLSSQKKKAVLLKNSLPAFPLDVYAPEIISQTDTGGIRSPRPPFFHRGQSAGPRC